MTNNVLMLSNVCFIGVGQAGGNIANQFSKLGYTTFYINTSQTDLDTIDVPKQYKYCPPAASGTSKNRGLAKGYFKKYENIIIEIVKARLGSFRHIFVCASAGGGTGSGMLPMMLESLSENIKDITFGAIVSLPDLKESYKIKHNAQECIDELKDIETIGNTYIIDNNACFMGNVRSPLENIDSLFANSLNDFLSVSHASKKGVIDEKEILTMLAINGYSVIANINSNAKDKKDKVVISAIMPKPNSVALRLAYNLNDDRDYIQDEVEALLGKASLSLSTYSDMPPFVVAFGLDFPMEKMNQISESANSDRIIMEDSALDKIVNTTQVVVEEYIDPVLRVRKDKDISSKLKKKISDMVDINNF